MQGKPHNNNSRQLLAVFLIVFGVLWLFKQSGVFTLFPFHAIFEPFLHIAHRLGHLIFSWPMVLIVVGLVLMAGRRKAGVVLLIVGGIFLIPRLFFPGMTAFLLLPVLLIGFGVAIVARIL
ncbi:MAG: LiaF transmembrane domain-containing protein [Draconibacterium sp.]